MVGRSTIIIAFNQQALGMDGIGQTDYCLSGFSWIRDVVVTRAGTIKSGLK